MAFFPFKAHYFLSVKLEEPEEYFPISGILISSSAFGMVLLYIGNYLEQRFPTPVLGHKGVAAGS